MKFRYEKQANALLRGQGLAPVGPIGLIGRIKRNGIAKSARRARRTAWFAAQTKFRMLPSDERRAIIGKVQSRAPRRSGFALGRVPAGGCAVMGKPHRAAKL